MPSVWVRRRLTAKGKRRFIVEYRIGGRGRPIRYGGSFGTAAEAATRKAVISGELAALRVPNLRILDPNRSTRRRSGRRPRRGGRPGST
jgi:hypothetical protein